jgi:hypothetical protein
MAHGIGGNVIGMTLAGGAINFKLQGWDSEVTFDDQDDTCPGDAYHSRIPAFGDWEINFTGYVPDQAARHVLIANETTLGTEVAFVLKEKASDTNGVFSGTGLAKSLRIDASDKDRPIGIRGRLLCSTGLAPTWDTTPLT